MVVWILNSRQGSVLPALMIRGIDGEEALVRYESGQRMSVPRRFIFTSPEEARRALARTRETERATCDS